MQEDKEPLFDAADSIELCVAAMTGMIRDLKANPERMRAVASADYSVATDLADWLVREVGLPFRQAHHATGALVGKASAKGVDLETMAGQVGTPFYCYSAGALRAGWQEFAAALKGMNASVCYALKANSNLAVVKLFGDLGAGADIVSVGEMRRALAAGISPRR